jgi:hypothetical protein
MGDSSNILSNPVLRACLPQRQFGRWSNPWLHLY